LNFTAGVKRQHKGWFMGQIIQFPRSRRQQESVELVGQLLRDCYGLGMPADPEMDIWLKFAEMRLSAHQAAADWQTDLLNQL